MFPYWFDCRDDGVDFVLALSDHSLPHLCFILINFSFIFRIL
ncbi:hypothetical protein OIU76_001499 [Salix suchowensis]|uniref:Uncharacterized protein n=2 Tax=Salix TaxID=40685 RepID=A0A9Q0WXZ9_SALPP|nr:hypothetical protein OIU76_001499 [Salix suchowensis]KAJ6399415.1 hypothetical protein OIU77_020044 [Salix suchowensis]KAJ6773755.1 hypothetical protein OIU79_017248 [Salix purpurea]